MNKLLTKHLPIILLLLFLSVTSAYARTDIKGKLENCNNCRVSLIIDQSDFEVDKKFLPSQPDRFGNFVFELKQILRPTVLILEVNTERFPIYVEPDSQIWITVNGANNSYHVSFDQGLVAENVHLKNWFQKNGWVGDRVAKNIWFEDTQVGVDSALYSDFMQRPDYVRAEYIVNYYKQIINDVHFNLPSNVTPAYQEFIRTYVDNAATAMMYTLLAEQKLTDEEKQKVTSATLGNFFDVNDRGNLAFVPHLKSYINFESHHAQKPRSQFNDFFYFVWQNAGQIPMQLKKEYLLHILRKELSPDNVLLLKPTVEAFTKSLSDLDQMALLLDDYQSAITRANGRKAPNFRLQNTRGEMVSLESLQGKKIFLAFWSSTCKPCIEGMKKSVKNKQLLKEEDIVFLYISTDLTKSTWLGNTNVRNPQPNDLHLWIGKSQPELHEYNAITLPTYYFIDENGNFVTRFPKSWDAEFVEFVVER